MEHFFSHERFLLLNGGELVAYVEPFVTTENDAIPESAYDVLQTSIARLDEAHTVYALEICMLLNPDEFVSHLVEFLSHGDSSVCSTAYRLMKGVSSDLMPADIVVKIHSTPVVDLFASDVHSGDRIRIGTNEELIDDLKAEFTND